ncbi:hypothetical protein BH18ACT8_BH18ACT8_15860 [soil metagenome]
MSQLDTTSEVASRPWVARNLAGSDLVEAFLIAAVVAVLTLRTFLAATGYPQVGGSRLHIAHLLYGGLVMLVAIMMLLLLVGSRVHSIAAWVGGLGFGSEPAHPGRPARRDRSREAEPVSSSGWSWDESLYAGSAAHYASGRLPYPVELADAVRTCLRLALSHVNVGWGHFQLVRTHVN